MVTGRGAPFCPRRLPELAKAPQIYICLIQGSKEIITKAFYSIADRPEFDLFVVAPYIPATDSFIIFFRFGGMLGIITGVFAGVLACNFIVFISVETGVLLYQGVTRGSLQNPGQNKNIRRAIMTLSVQVLGRIIGTFSIYGRIFQIRSDGSAGKY